MVTIANAPVSYGVFGLSRPDLAHLPDGETLCRWVSAAGYAGIDLGELGLLGIGDELVDRLRRHALALAGGWIEFPFAGDADAFDAAVARLDPVLDQFLTVAAAGLGPAGLPTIADAGDAARRARPGGGEDLRLTGDDWLRFADRVGAVAAHVRSRGLEPTFHHHACTYVETPAEIDALLESTDVGLTFDTGHLLIGGGDPVRDYRRWRHRINHLHLKDVDVTVLRDALGAGESLEEVWERRVFVPLGEGELDLTGIVDAILGSGFDGWIVVEQDVVAQSDDDIARAREDQVRNLTVLRSSIS